MVFRVFDDGVGFRYEFPEQPSLTQVNIVEELTEFDIAEPATAWWIPGGEWNRYEYLYQQNAADRSRAGAYAVDAARLRAACTSRSTKPRWWITRRMWLRRVIGAAAEGRAVAIVERARGEPQGAVRDAVAHAADRDRSAPGLYMSDLILNLNEPNKLGDVSWVKPFKYVGIWWGMHLGTKTWASGPKHGATTAETKRYIDFAAQTRLSRRARGRLEQGLGRRLVRQRR